MDPRLSDMVRGVAGAPDRLLLVRGLRCGEIYAPAGSVIERRGDFSFFGGYRFALATLIWLARMGAVVVDDGAHGEGEQQLARTEGCNAAAA